MAQWASAVLGPPIMPFARIFSSVCVSGLSYPLLCLFSSLQRACFRFVTWRWFDHCIAAVISANIAVMCIRHANEEAAIVAVEDTAGIVFTAIFGLEALVKLMGLGLRQYFRSPWNWFDFSIVAGSIAATAADFSSVGLLLRVFRVLRVFRLIRVSATLQQLGATFIFSLPSFVNIMAITGMAFFIYAIVGMHLFAGVRAADVYNLNADVHFNDFATSFMTLIRCSTGENW